MFVTYGLQLQPDEPREQYVAFLALFAAAFCVIDFAVTEIYMDKIGEGEPKSRTALIKMEVMSWFSHLSLIHISEPTRLLSISYAVFCLKKKKKKIKNHTYMINIILMNQSSI
eukprot:TRINITY_DN7984_c0_g1_i8.p2 TRINITY_DN7984_c0_g1~~TRINITY_DN7984_c0_g1_i8.p2  ORF type:complete len:113 (-),score=18.54 TRINITY_DN7984_c0_g1_i8:58-396(-)